MDTSQWPPQGIKVVKTIDGTRAADQRKARPQKDQALNCPRCNSTNTKFCYYNNYNLSQPRYFCKTCRRYWTEGGSLRNVPVGGGSRKNKRISTSSSASTSISIPSFSNFASDHHQNPKTTHQAQDLNLSYPSTDHHHHHDYNTNLSKFIQLPPPNNNHSSTTGHSSQFSAMEFLKNDNNIVSESSNAIYSSSGFPILQDFKPTLNFTLDGFENGYGGTSLQGAQQINNGGSGGSSSSARLLFPFEELKQVSSTTDQFDHNRSGNGDSTGYWINGMLGGGGSW